MNNQGKKSYKIVTINGVKISYLYRPKLKKGPKISIIFLFLKLGQFFEKASFSTEIFSTVEISLQSRLLKHVTLSG